MPTATEYHLYTCQKCHPIHELLNSGVYYYGRKWTQTPTNNTQTKAANVFNDRVHRWLEALLYSVNYEFYQ